MNRSAKVRAIYYEIRSKLGEKVSQKEALTAAARLVEIFGADEDAFDEPLQEQRAAFQELPLDIAIADGGWRVLSKEKVIANIEFGGEDVDVRARVRMRLRYYGLGTRT